MPERERNRPAGRGRVFISNFGEGVTGGGSSLWDARFPDIRDVIRARNRSAAYRSISLPGGGDPQVKAMQDRLVALGYLEARHADGTVGRSKSPTLDAVKAFQRRNGLAADRNLGGSGSLGELWRYGQEQALGGQSQLYLDFLELAFNLRSRPSRAGTRL